jgi:acyl-CoA synthetase (NDP forming)
MFVSLGNKADVSGNDLLEYWSADDQTRVILMYLESFGNPQKFLQIARRVSKKKPILAMKSGRTAAGARGGRVAYRVAGGHRRGRRDPVPAEWRDPVQFDRGDVRLRLGLATQPIPKGDRVAIVTNSGGPGILATDTLVQLGLTVAPLSAATQARMRPHIAPEASTVNPVDMIASARGPQYEACMSAVIEDPDVDAVIAIFTSLESIDSMAVANGIIRGAGHGKPVLVCFKEGEPPAVAHMGLRPARLHPSRRGRARNVGAARHRQWLERPGRVVAFDDIDRAAIDRLIARERVATRPAHARRGPAPDRGVRDQRRALARGGHRPRRRRGRRHGGIPGGAQGELVGHHPQV